MGTGHIDAGALNERIEVLALEQSGNELRWKTARRSWARVELTGKRSNFSTHGIGAAEAVFTIRRQELTVENAFHWRGMHCFLTTISPTDSLHLEVRAALVEVSGCRDPETGLSFSGIVTEKYLGHQQLEPQAVNTLRHVLVTPKAVLLKPGRLVEVGGVLWPIKTAHLLDPAKNEYEIEREVEL